MYITSYLTSVKLLHNEHFYQFSNRKFYIQFKRHICIIALLLTSNDYQLSLNTTKIKKKYSYFEFQTNILLCETNILIFTR